MLEAGVESEWRRRHELNEPEIGMHWIDNKVSLEGNYTRRYAEDWISSFSCPCLAKILSCLVRYLRIPAVGQRLIFHSQNLDFIGNLNGSQHKVVR